VTFAPRLAAPTTYEVLAYLQPPRPTRRLQHTLPEARGPPGTT
jgi:hypothetical protein